MNNIYLNINVHVIDEEMLCFQKRVSFQCEVQLEVLKKNKPKKATYKYEFLYLH